MNPKHCHISVFFILWLLLSLQSCDKNEVFVDDPIESDEDSVALADAILISGTGSFIFDSYAPLANKPVEVFYHIPDNASSSSPVLFLLHGGARDGMYSRDQLILKANQLNFILVCPEFSTTYYPGGDSYNLGNIFEDGDNPSPASLNDKNQWTFAVIEPIFDKIIKGSISKVNTYDMLGFSAGAQVAHRFMIFEPNARVNRIVASASGWYTVLDDQIIFPYGLKDSPAEQLDLTSTFLKEIYLIVGENDNDPNAPGLRRNNQADAQGLNRLDRTNHFYENAEALASALSSSFNWQRHVVSNLNHDFFATSIYAVDLLY